MFKYTKALFIIFWSLAMWRRYGLDQYLNYVKRKMKNNSLSLNELNLYADIIDKLLYLRFFKKIVKPTCLKVAIIHFYLSHNYKGKVVFIMAFRRFTNLRGRRQLGGHSWIEIDDCKWPEDFDSSMYTITYSVENR